MQIQKDKVVSIDYTLTNDEGQVLDSSEGREPLAYLHGSGNIIPGLEKALEGRSEGDELEVKVSPEEGYGVRDESKLTQVPREMFADAGEVQIGAQYYAQGPNGEVVTVTVVGADEENVSIDANHPLAGQNLNFAVTVREVRDATEEELSHGHAHGAGGHHHE